MPYCSRCGVEVDDHVVACPLCEAPIQHLPSNDGSPWPKEEAPLPTLPPLSTDERKALARTITTLGFLIPVAISLGVDWFVDRAIGWSLYVLTSLGACWLWAIIPLALSRRSFLLIIAETAVALGFLLSLDGIVGGTTWIPSIGLPVVAAAGLTAAGVTAMAQKSKRVGTNLAGWILVGLSVLTFLTDLLIDMQAAGAIRPGWSIVVVSTTIPIAILLFYLHYRPSRRTRLRRYFHV